jgi:glycosyltransferase involved in cell wall biosynthesis
MSSETPKALSTALIDTFNQERYIEQAILSVLDQGLSPSELEIVVVDDGSTDGTSAIVQKFLPRVRYLRKENGGQASAFNAAIPELHGEIVSFLDGDDWWARGKLRAIIDAFAEHPDVAAVGHGFFEVYGENKLSAVVPDRKRRIDLSTVDSARLSFSARRFLGTSKLSLRRIVLNRMGPIPNELIFCADVPLQAWVLALGGALLLDQPLCYYRLHADNLFQFDSQNLTAVSRRYQMLAISSGVIAKKLGDLSIPPEVISAFLVGDRIDIARVELRTQGGPRWKTLTTEMEYFRSEYKNSSPGYVLFKWFVGALALLLPPRQFYQLRDWYGRRGLSRFRHILGKADSVHSQSFVHRYKAAPDQPTKTPATGENGKPSRA